MFELTLCKLFSVLITNLYDSCIKKDRFATCFKKLWNRKWFFYQGKRGVSLGIIIKIIVLHRKRRAEIVTSNQNCANKPKKKLGLQMGTLSTTYREQSRHARGPANPNSP